MKIFFGTTTSKWKEYKEYYFAIRNYLRDSGCVVLFDWLEDADENINTPYKTRNITKIYEQVIHALDEADAVVIEYTVQNFSSSHQINYTIMKRKPVLIMRLKKDNPRYNDSYLDGLQSPYLKIADYTIHNYKEILDEFIGYSRIEQGQQRYNIVLDKKQKYYLDWAATEYKKSRSNIIRELIDTKIDQDQKYKKYINRKSL